MSRRRCICDPASYVVAVCHGHDRLDCPLNPHYVTTLLAPGDQLQLDLDKAAR